MVGHQEPLVKHARILGMLAVILGTAAAVQMPRARRMSVRKVFMVARTVASAWSDGASKAYLPVSGLRFALDLKLQRMMRSEEPICAFIYPITRRCLSLAPATAEEIAAHG